MKKVLNTKFYVFKQNNSGGYFIKNDEVSCYVIIEAITPEDAKNKAESIFEPHSEYCSCCGPRWDTDMEWVDYYNEPPELKPDMFIERDEAIIYYIDGSKKRYNLTNE